MQLFNFRRFGWAALSCLCAAAPVPRTTVDLDADWRFERADVPGAAGPNFDAEQWASVDLPHTWNNKDGQDGGNNYHRGPAWYRRHLLADPAWAGRRVYLRVGAANIDSAVYVNGRPAGTHKGGFAAFCYDVTSLLNPSGDNVLAVRVDNARDADVAPLSADFTFFGGLYRGVSLIVTDPLSISPIDDGSAGVYVRQDHVTADEARLTVTTVVRNASETDRSATVHADVAGVTADATQLVKAGQSVNVEQRLVVPHPHLWNGRADPFEYPARVTVSDGGRVTDAVEQRVGFRFYRTDPETGFYLNGKPYHLHGVNRHQDRLDKGWALSADDERGDAANILDLGCTAVRLAHYQQSPSFYDLMDAGGVVVWAEIPLVNEVTASAAFADNAEQQLRELIKQNYNHPSICFWGLFNELRGTPAREVDEIPVVERLNAAAHRFDPTRPTTAASDQSAQDGLATIPDVCAYNRYVGWYTGHPDGWPTVLDEFHAAHPKLCIGMSEYGAGASIFQHVAAPVPQPKASNSTMHPEEYQAIVHEQAWAAMKARPWIWGTFIWNLHDFASDSRKEGDQFGRNDKGLVTYDGRTRKDAFYFYQANWSERPMVYVTDRRYTPRPSTEGPIKVYSNCGEVRLSVNGRSLGSVRPNDEHVFIWPDVQLRTGENRVEATATRGGDAVSDGYTVIVAPNAK